MSRIQFIKMLSAFLVVGLIAPCTCCADGSDLKKALLGTWVAGGDSIQFLKDGAAIARSTTGNGQASISGSYEVAAPDASRVESDPITVTFNGLGDFALPFTGRLLEGGAVLLLKKGNGSAQKFTRAK